MATSLRSQKRGPHRENSRKYLSFEKKYIGPADPEIIWLKYKKKKLGKVKYIAQSASLPSGLKEDRPRTSPCGTSLTTVSGLVRQLNLVSYAGSELLHHDVAKA